MNRNYQPAAVTSLDTCSYMTPIVSAIDMKIEGMLCQSGQLENWWEDDLDW